MRRLRRGPSAHSSTVSPTAAGRPARAAVVVPNGTLFGDGVCGRIKQELLKEFNLHTIVRLPNGVFAPYTSIPTNILFFDRSGPTREVWYYEHPLPEGRKNYTKTAPLQFEEFAPLIAWWGGAKRAGREENAQAWKVSAADLLASGANLDRHQSARKKGHHPSPARGTCREHSEERAAHRGNHGQHPGAHREAQRMSKPWPRCGSGGAASAQRVRHD